MEITAGNLKGELPNKKYRNALCASSHSVHKQKCMFVQSKGRKCLTFIPTFIPSTCYVIMVHKIMGEKHTYSIIKLIFKNKTNVKFINVPLGSSDKF